MGTRGMNNFGDEVGRLRTERGLSLRELARLSHYDVGYLSKVSSGRKRGSRELALRLDKLLGTDGQLIAAWDATSRSPVPASPLASIAPDADLYDRITRAADDAPRVDLPVVQWLENTLDEHRRVEDSVGARPLRLANSIASVRRRPASSGTPCTISSPDLRGCPGRLR